MQYNEYRNTLLWLNTYVIRVARHALYDSTSLNSEDLRDLSLKCTSNQATKIQCAKRVFFSVKLLLTVGLINLQVSSEYFESQKIDI